MPVSVSVFICRVLYCKDLIKQLTVIDEYICHGEVAGFCVVTSVLVMRINFWTLAYIAIFEENTKRIQLKKIQYF